MGEADLGGWTARSRLSYLHDLGSVRYLARAIERYAAASHEQSLNCISPGLLAAAKTLRRLKFLRKPVILAFCEQTRPLMVAKDVRHTCGHQICDDLFPDPLSSVVRCVRVTFEKSRACLKCARRHVALSAICESRRYVAATM